MGTDVAAALQASVSFLPSAHLGSPMPLHRCRSGPKQDFDVEGSPLPVLLFAGRSFFAVFIPVCHPAPAISFSCACLPPLPYSSVLLDSLAHLAFLSSSASLSCPMVFTSPLLALSSCPLLCPLLGGQHSLSRPHPGTSFLLAFLPLCSSLLAAGARTGEPSVCLIILLWLLDTAHLDPGAQMCGCHSDLSPSGKYRRPPAPEQRAKQLCDLLLSRDSNVLPPVSPHPCLQTLAPWLCTSPNLWSSSLPGLPILALYH